MPGQDPWVVSLGGSRYWLVQSRGERSIVAFEFDGDRLTDMHELWKPSRHSDHNKQLWAPELHYFNKWGYVIYYAACDGLNRNHRNYALHSHTLSGPYREIGKVYDPEHDVWAIDLTVLEIGGQLYAIWSGWDGANDQFPQNLYIAPMSDPWTICGQRQLLARPDLPWEMTTAQLLEGPQVWQWDNQLLILYSADASWSDEYKMGALVWNGGPVASATSWRKLPRPILRAGGHGSVVTIAGREWLVYHRKNGIGDGWADREISWAEINRDQVKQEVLTTLSAAA